MAVTKTILVVEDDAIAREGLSMVLRRAGYEVILATHGEEALTSVRCVRPDLIMLDMLMPVMDGWLFLERLKAESPSLAIPIIVVTGTITILCREWAVDHGCCGFLRKPIDLNDIPEEIGWCLATCRLRTN
jgi:CheY-like chemotaxis protein